MIDGTTGATARQPLDPSKNEAGHATAKKTSAGAHPDRKLLLAKLHLLNQEKLELAEIAQEESTSPRVRDYVTDLIRKTRSADTRILAEAGAFGVDERALGNSFGLVESRSERDDREQDLERLRRSSGPDFNLALRDAVLRINSLESAVVQNALASNVERDVRSLLADLVPAIEEERRAAEQLGAGLSGP